MTSEVLMLNKDAVVIAADSAVTTGRDPHPRYSKAANKIFDLSYHGNVAVTIYSAAEIDNVPWELALKQFRKQDSQNPQRPKLQDYVNALTSYLQGNTTLFPNAFQAELLNNRFFQAAINVLNVVEYAFPDFVDESKSEAERIAAWTKGYQQLASNLHSAVIQSPLTDIDFQDLLSKSKTFQTLLEPEIAISTKYKHADASQVTQLAIENLVKYPTEFLNYTGLVFAGYGDDEIFPSFHHVKIYGHIGKTLLWTYYNGYTITHNNDSWIQPFAQSSMIDRFTDGFDSTLKRIIKEESMDTFKNILTDLDTAGIKIPDTISSPIVTKRNDEFMTNWIKKNWDVNFHPLKRVLNSLSVPEMGHLAESLLVLEALRERVTSPSESVGGPIDVVVITKSEGLIWLKRKHFFDPDLNIKYLNRSKVNYN